MAGVFGEHAPGVTRLGRLSRRCGALHFRGGKEQVDLALFRRQS